MTSHTEPTALSTTPTLSETVARLWNRLPSLVQALLPVLTALLIVLVPANFLISSRFYQITTENVGAQHQAVLADIGGQFERYFTARGVYLSDFARRDEIVACAPAGCTDSRLFAEELAVRLRDPDVYTLEIGFINLNGRETGRALRGSGGIIAAPGDLPLFEVDSPTLARLQALQIGQTYIFPVARDPRISPGEAYQQPMIRFAASVRSADGQISGYVTAAYGMDDFFAQQFVPAEGRVVFLLDTERCLLATSDTARRAETYNTWSGAPNRTCYRDLPIQGWDVSAQRYRDSSGDTLFSTRALNTGLITSEQAWTIVVQQNAALVYEQANALQTLLTGAHLLTIIMVVVVIVGADQAAKRLANVGQIRLAAHAREMRYNPYIYREPVDDPGLFFGRKVALANVIGMGVMGGEDVLIVGEPGSGKTSLLRQIERRLRDQRVPDPTYWYWSVALNAQGITQGRFYSALMERILRDVEDHPARTDLRYHRYAAGEGAGYGPQDFHEDVNELIELPNAGGRQTRLVLLIDNLDAWIDYTPAWRTAFLEMVTHVGTYLTLIGTCTPAVEPLFADWLSVVRIGALDREEAIRLIREPVAKYYQFTDEAVEYILDKSRQMPNMLQHLAHDAVRVMLEQEGMAVTRAHAERAYRQLRDS